MRQAIAKHMVNSWQISPKCDYFMRADVARLLEYRAAYNINNGCKVSFLGIVMMAAAQVLKEFPYVNSSYDFGEQVHILHEGIHLGFAMSIDNGLLVLKVNNTDQLSPQELENEMNRLITAANDRKLTMDDITGSTLTINNMGAYDRLQFHTAIINQPELAILSMYRVQDEAVVKDGRVEVGKIMQLALSADHRVIDGKMACEFLNNVCELLEAPEKFLTVDGF